MPAGSQRQRHLDQTPRLGRSEWLWVCLLITAGAALRLWQLGAPSLWIDEAYSMTDAWNAIGPGSIAETPKYPLSYVLIRFGLELRGWNEVGARLIPCLLGVATLPVVYLWMRIRSGKALAVLSSLFLLISPWHQLLSQNARYYTLLTLVVLLLAILVERWLFTGRWPYCIAALGCLVLGMATHPATGFSLVPPAVFLVSCQRVLDHRLRLFDGKHFRLVAVLIIAGVLGASPFIIETLTQHWNEKSGFSVPLLTTSLAWHAGAATLILAAAGFVRSIQRKDAFVSYACLSGFGLLFVAGLVSIQVRVNHQYVVAALPFLCIAVGYLVLEAWRAGGLMIGIGLAGAAIAESLAGMYLYFGPLNGFRSDWRSAALLVLEEIQPGDYVASNQAPIVEYYLNPASRNLREGTQVLALSKWNDDMQTDLVHRPGRVWFVFRDPDTADWFYPHEASFRTHLRDRCRFVTEFRNAMGPKDLTVRVFVRDR